MESTSFFIPVEPEFACEDAHAVFGAALNYNCRFFTNPSVDYFTVELPNGQIVNGTTDNIAFAVGTLEVSAHF